MNEMSLSNTVPRNEKLTPIEEFVDMITVDIFQSVVVPRPTRRSLRLAPLLLNGMWSLWKWIALRFPSAKYRCIEDGPAGPAHLLYQSGCQLVNDLKDYFKVSPAQAQAGTSRISFEAAYTRLKSSGFCLADPEHACASFIALRSAYEDALQSLMKYWVVSQRKF
jgi:hypothetical protein